VATKRVVTQSDTALRPLSLFLSFSLLLFATSCLHGVLNDLFAKPFSRMSVALRDESNEHN
jgi:hypothetical protein